MKVWRYHPDGRARLVESWEARDMPDWELMPIKHKKPKKDKHARQLLEEQLDGIDSLCWSDGRLKQAIKARKKPKKVK